MVSFKRSARDLQTLAEIISRSRWIPMFSLTPTSGHDGGVEAKARYAVLVTECLRKVKVSPFGALRKAVENCQVGHLDPLCSFGGTYGTDVVEGFIEHLNATWRQRVQWRGNIIDPRSSHLRTYPSSPVPGPSFSPGAALF